MKTLRKSTISRRTLSLLLSCLFILMFSINTQAQATFNSVATGNWNSITSWVIVGGVDGDGIPDADDNVIIKAGHTITVNVNAAANSIAFTGNTSATLSLSAGKTLDVTGNVNITAPATNGYSATIAVGSGTLNVGANLSFVGANTNRNAILTATTGTISVAGNISFSGPVANCRFTFSGAGKLNIGGVFGTGGTFSPSLSTIAYNGNGNQSIASYAHYSLSLSGGGTKSLGAALSLAGNLTIDSGTIFDAGTNNITVTGDFSNSGTFIQNAANRITFNKTNGNQMITSTGNTAFQTVVVTKGAVSNKLIVNGSVTVASGGSGNGISFIAGTWEQTSGILTFGGTNAKTFSVAAGSLVASGSSSVVFNAPVIFSSGNFVVNTSGSVDINGALNRLEISGTANIQFQSGAVNVDGRIGNVLGTGLLTGGSLSISGAQVHVGAAGVNNNTYGIFMIGSGMNFSLTGGTLHIVKANQGGYTGNDIDIQSGTISAGSIEIGNGAGSGSTDFKVRCDVAASQLIINTGSRIVNIETTPISVNASVVRTSGVINLNNQHLYVKGNWINNTTDPVQGSGAVIFNGSIPQTISGTATASFNNVDINNSNDISLTTDMSVASFLSFTDGKINAGTKSVLLDAAANIFGAGPGKYVNGMMIRKLSTASSGFTFEIGDDNTYAPVNISVSGVSNNTGSISAITVAGDHPQIAGSGIISTMSVNRYWTLTNNGVNLGSYNATFNFDAADADAGADPAAFVIKRYAAGTWDSTTTGSLDPTSSQAVNLGSNAFGDFQIGNTCVLPEIDAPLVTNLTCNGVAEGAISLTLHGGTGPFEFVWTGPNGFTANTQNIAGLAAGVYSVSIGAFGGCSTSVNNITVTQPTAISLDNVVKTSYNGADLSCANATDGEITITASGGTGLLQYSIDNGNTFQPENVFSGLSAGTYTVVVKDDNNCTSSSSSVTITAPAALSVSVTASTDILCAGSATGAVTVSASGGTAPYLYSIDGVNFQDDNTFTGLLSGMYVITVQDANLCSAETSVTINEPATPLSGYVSETIDASCYSSFDGSMTVEATGGVPPYQYSIDGLNFQSSPVFSNLPAGDYVVTIKDSNNCTYDYPQSVLTMDFTPPTITCLDTTTVVVNPQTGVYLLEDFTTQVTVSDNCNDYTQVYQSMAAGTELLPGTFDITMTAIDQSGNSSQCTFTLIVTSNDFYSTGYITGPTDACPYTGTATEVDYFVETNANATSYVWNSTAGINIVSGNGTNNIKVTFDANFTRGNVSVFTVYPNGNGPVRTYTIGRLIPNSIGRIYGPAGACSYVGNGDTATYYINKVRYATSYIWSVPSTVTIVDRPGGVGTENDTVIRVTFAGNFISGSIGVQASSNCYTGLPRILPISLQAPAQPGVISGQSNACPFIDADTSLVYTIKSVKYATSYIWTVPTGATILFGQGDTSIMVSYDNTFTSGYISVVSVSNCGSSAPRLMAITRKMPATPGTITGPTDACPLMGTNTTATYSIRKVMYATSYTWNVPEGATILSTPGDTSIIVSFDNSFSGGAITVTANSNCSVSALRSLMIYKRVPAAPGMIYGPTDACPTMGINTSVLYYIRKVMYATSYNWTVPDGADIVGTMGDTAIYVLYSNNFVSGSITVSASNNCSTGPTRSLTITRKLPIIPGAITAVPEACPSRNVTYSIAPTANTTYYMWTKPAGSVFVGDSTSNVVTITYPASPVTGAVTVRSVNNCATSATRSLSVFIAACPQMIARAINPVVTTENKPTMKTNPVIEALQVKVLPNPSQDRFRIVLSGVNNNTPVTMRITDINGRLIEMKENISAQSISLGETYKRGVYLATFIQAKQTRMVKLIKL